MMKKLASRLRAVAVSTFIPLALSLPAFASQTQQGAPPASQASKQDEARGFGSGAPKGLVQKKSYRGPKVPYVRHRRGLAVIADFSDNRLEDWSGDGVRNVAQLSDQLHRMEDHWEWLSGGLEDFRWDVIRITLPTALSPDAYPDLNTYREAVAALIRQQVSVSNYDANRDGVIDSAWVIASNRGAFYGYMAGGTSLNGGVNLFVDIQNSLSLVVGATGNFNHELAHTLGVPDLYGTYDTLHYLTVMSDSWALPPQGFTAYERQALGWLRPRLIDSGSRNVHLKLSKGHKGDAVRIDSANPSEYFLIEYRRRPDTGFGSNAPAYNGLAVYHVLEGSNQWSDPPLLKLEAADGFIAAGTSPELNDFLFIDNLSMKRPLVLKSYFGGAEVFRIDNLFWAGPEGLGFNVVVAPKGAPVNLLANPSFEQGNGSTVVSWTPDAWVPTASFARDQQVTHEGRYSVSIQSLTENDARWIQDITGLVPGRSYQLCGWVKGENIVTSPGAPVGANVSLLGGFVASQSFSGTFDWTRACVSFQAETSTVTAACRIGFYSSTVTGRLWCDEMSLTPLNSAFEP